MSYNQRIDPIITRNNGFINQYLGDGNMAIFSQKLDDALHAAIETQRYLIDYNKERAKKGCPEIHLGIGFHTGKLIMGIIGDLKRMDATTIADSVNTASRIENLNKYYGTRILFSENSLDKLENPSKFNYRYLGKVVMKGKQVPIGIYECFDGDPEEIRSLKSKTLTRFEQALMYYFEKNFIKAVELLKEIVDANPQDVTARLFLDKAMNNKSVGVLEDWSGVQIMQEK